MNFSEPDKLRVIYCMGSGRSGSTLFGIIMGSHPKLVNPGELNNISRISQDTFNCSCLKRVSDCEYWNQVFKNWEKLSKKDEIEEFLRINSKIEKINSPLAWIKALLNYPFQKPFLKRYLKNSYYFMKSITEVSDQPVIIDISKNPLRAYLMLKNPMIDLRLVHLVRDGRGVAWSLNKFTKKSVKQKSVSRTAIFWVIVNRMSNYVRKRAKNEILCKYEDMVSNPKEYFQQIANFSEINPEPLINILETGLVENEGHIMAGNKLRRNKSIKLKLNTDWEKGLTNRKKFIFRIIAKKTMKRYSYD